jgi:hypothetical protein
MLASLSAAPFVDGGQRQWEDSCMERFIANLVNDLDSGKLDPLIEGGKPVAFEGGLAHPPPTPRHI